MTPILSVLQEFLPKILTLIFSAILALFGTGCLTSWDAEAEIKRARVSTVFEIGYDQKVTLGFPGEIEFDAKGSAEGTGSNTDTNPE